MSAHEASRHDEPYVYEPWYKYGIAVLFLEAAIAVGVSIFSISMGLSGKPVAFKKHVVFEKKQAVVAPAAPNAVTSEQCKSLERQLQDCLKATETKK